MGQDIGCGSFALRLRFPGIISTYLFPQPQSHELLLRPRLLLSYAQLLLASFVYTGRNNTGILVSLTTIPDPWMMLTSNKAAKTT